MPAVRTDPRDLEAMAIDDLVALGRVGDLEVTATGPQTVSFRVPGDEWSATVVAVDSAGVADARGLTAAATDTHVVVANKLSEDARAHFAREGWSWFDRRIGAHLAYGERTLDIRFVERDPLHDDGARSDTLLAAPRSDGPIRGRAGISYAAALLLDPDQPPTMRAVAREVHMSPTAISNAAKLLAAQGLVVDGHPALPDLFWALADVWRPVKIASVATVPDPGSPQLAYNLDDLDSPGWAIGGDRAALELGAPVFTTDDRPWFWVPNQAEARRAQRALGVADPEQRTATIAVPPTPLVVARRIPPTKGSAPWPLTHPVFVALELARDPGRGREILDHWRPEGITRVWA